MLTWSESYVVFEAYKAIAFSKTERTLCSYINSINLKKIKGYWND